MKAKWIALLLVACCLLLPAAASAQAQDHNGMPLRPVQAFDVAAGKVVKSVPNGPEFQKYAADWLASITGPAPQLKPDDKCGYVFRIPLHEPAEVQAGSLHIRTWDVFLFYCPDKPTLLLLFDENRKPYLLQFKADIKPFLKTMGVS